MIFVSASQFHVYLILECERVSMHFAKEGALEGPISVIVKCEMICRPVTLCCDAMLLTSHNLGHLYPLSVCSDKDKTSCHNICRAAVVSYLSVAHRSGRGFAGLLLTLDISILRLRCDVRILQSSVTRLSII